MSEAASSKALFSCYTKADSIDRVRALATQADVPIGDLVGLLLDYGAERLSVDKLRDWAKSQPSRRGPLGGSLTKPERAVLRALDELFDREDKVAFRFGTDDVAASAGLRMADAYNALSSLKQKGQTALSAPPGPDGAPEQDRWGRATKAVWWRPEHAEQARMLNQARMDGLGPSDLD